MNHGIKAIHARKPSSAGGKERHRRRIVRKEKPESFTKFVLLKVLRKLIRIISLKIKGHNTKFWKFLFNYITIL
jgi:hypothetical protein